MVHISELPPHIIIQIFRYYLCSANQKDLLLNISRVCKDWEELCSDMSLWMKFDGTVPYKGMKALSKNGCLHNTTDFTFSKIKHLKGSEAKNVLSSLKKVESVDLKNVNYFSEDFWTILKQNTPNLKAISIGNDSENISKEGSSCLKHYDMVPFLKEKGKFLTSIKISHCMISNCRLILNAIATFCPNLEMLHLSDLIYTVTVQSFPLKKFQVGCPKLKTLHLDNSFNIKYDKQLTGFPELETFSFIAHSVSANPLADYYFKCITKNSPKLKFLYLSECEVSSEALYSMPADSVEYLFIPKTRAFQSACDVTQLCDVLRRWSHSLKQVDISNATDISVNTAISALVTSSTNSKLEFLDLSCTAVLPSTVEKIIQNCKNLKYLHLQGCRHLDRHLKRNYSGKAELEILSKKLKLHLLENSEENAKRICT